MTGQFALRIKLDPAEISTYEEALRCATDLADLAMFEVEILQTWQGAAFVPVGGVVAPLEP